MTEFNEKPKDDSSGASYDIAPVPEQENTGASDPANTPDTAGKNAAGAFDPPAKNNQNPAGFDENRPKEYKKHKALQIVSGIVSAFAIWGALWFLSSAEGILSWLWVILFGVVFIGKRQIEKKKNVYYRIFTLSMLFGIIGAIALTLAADALFFHKMFPVK